MTNWSTLGEDFSLEKMLELKKKNLFCFEILRCISLQGTFNDVDRRPSKNGWLLLKVEINLFTESIIININDIMIKTMNRKKKPDPVRDAIPDQFCRVFNPV